MPKNPSWDKCKHCFWYSRVAWSNVMGQQWQALRELALYWDKPSNDGLDRCSCIMIAWVAARDRSSLLALYPPYCSHSYALKKKKINFFPKYKEIHSGAVAKSYMSKGFPIYQEMGKYFPIYKEAVSYMYMTLQLLHSEFPYIWGNFDFFFISAGGCVHNI
jgi:hypothetical protein